MDGLREIDALEVFGRERHQIQLGLEFVDVEFGEAIPDAGGEILLADVGRRIHAGEDPEVGMPLHRHDVALFQQQDGTLQ